MSRVAESIIGDEPVYPNHPGFTDTGTSLDAARKIRPATAKLYADLLTIIRLAGDRGLTSDEAAAMLGKSVLLVRPRFVELGPRHFNKIEKNGLRRTNESGMSAAAYRIRK